MADLKISALNSLAGADLVAADVVAVVDDSASETKKLTVSDLIANGTTLISDATIPSAKILFSAGSIATASVADSGITTAKVADSSITAAKLADNSSVTLVSTLPGSGDFTGQIALDTDDNKIYIWDGSAWDSVKGAGSINVVNGSTTGEINIVTSTSGDTVTVSATLDDTTAAALFLAGPTGAGGTVGYRAIIGTDLPTASTTAKGGVIVNGNGLTMSSDTIAINNTVTAETSENHIVQYDANGLVTGGRAIVAAGVPNATSTAAGIIKPGSGLGVTGAGELNHNNSVTAGTASKVTFDAQGHITGTESLVAADIPDLDADKITTGSVPTARIAADAVTAEKLADRSTATIAETTPAGGAFIGQTHLNSITGDYFLWDGNVWQPIGISVGEIILAGTYDASTNLMATVTSEGTALSFVVGSALPAASSANKGYYVVVSEAGTGTSPAPTVALNPPDFLLSTGTAYTEIDVSSTVTAQQASNVAFTAAGNIAATNVQSAIEELDTEKVAAASPSLTGTVSIGTGGTIQFEGATANDFESTLTVVDPTADRTLSLPDATGTLVSTGDTGTVTSTMITDGTIVNADINASAEIAVSKLANGTARQLLQTDVAGSGVEFTSNVDVPGTLDVTGAATLDSTLDVTGATTVTGVINADGKVKFPAGSASAPSFYSGTDTNTGLYFSAADEVSITTGGTQRVVVDSSGNVGIGNSSPSRELHIGDGTASVNIELDSVNTGHGTIFFGDPQSGASGRIRYDHSDNHLRFDTNGSERLRIDSSGNVGIGTSSPSHKLAIDSTSDADLFRIRSTANANNTSLRFGISGNDCEIHASGGSSGNLAFKTYGSERLRIDSSGNVGIGTTSVNANLQVHNSSANATLAINNGTVGSALTDGLTLISATDGTAFIAQRENADLIISTNNTERMRIDSSGNVGIGNTSPGSESFVVQRSGSTPTIRINAASSYEAQLKLQADGTATDTQLVAAKTDGSLAFARWTGAAYTERMQIQSDGTVKIGTGTGNPILMLNASTAGTSVIQMGDSADNNIGQIQYANSDDSMRFFANNSERLRIDSSGNVGIGTTSPAQKLHVVSAASTYVQVQNTGNSVNAYYGVDTGGAWVGASTNHPLKLHTNNTERLRIDSSGNVGIGTTSPGSELHLAAGDTNCTFKITNTSGGSGGLIQQNASDLNFNNLDSGNMRFYTADTERMRIDSSGRLLVGRTSTTGAGEDIQDSKGGIRSIPLNSQGAAYTLVVGDVGKFVRITTGGVTVPSGVFSAGEAVTIYNHSSSDQTITQGSSVTLRSAGTADTGNRTLAQRGVCTLLCVGTNEFVISGAGLS